MVIGIVGHERVRVQLGQQTAHAVMLEGPSRVGRRVLARWYAQLVNCRASVNGEPCGTCPSCLMFDAGTHPDYLEVGPKQETRTGKVARVNLIPISVVSASHDRDREYETHVTEWLETAARARAKVVVFDGAEFLNESAANALLKTIEEPPHGARFVFITEDASAVMPTIVSRSVRVRVPPVQDVDLERVLSNLEPELDLELLEFARGRPGIVFDRERARDALKTVRGFLESTQADLLDALTAADGLEKHWDRDFSPQAVLFLLRNRHASVRLRVDRALTELIESLEGYVTPSLAFAVFGLELRRALGLSD